MVIKSINLETVCGITSTLPDNDRPEVAFAGKSNVGKSSMINALMNRKSYARISATPGKTQTINFYNINDALYLVDLPGYGYARVSEKEKEQWGRMIERYLHSSSQLKAVFLLIDIRHDPSANDRLMYKWIVDQGYQPVIIDGYTFIVNTNGTIQHSTVEYREDGDTLIDASSDDIKFVADGWNKYALTKESAEAINWSNVDFLDPTDVMTSYVARSV